MATKADLRFNGNIQLLKNRLPAQELCLCVRERGMGMRAQCERVG